MGFDADLLWTACTAVLLSFLVAWLVSLILSCPNSVDEVREKGFKRAFIVGHDCDDGVKHKSLLKSSINGGGKVGRLRSTGSKQKKRIKFVDPEMKFGEIPSSDDAYVKDVEVVPCDGGKLVGVEVNAVDCGELTASDVASEGKEGIKRRESEEVGELLVDHREEGKMLVAFEEDEKRRCIVVGGELKSGENVADIDGFEGEEIVDKEDREGHDIDVILGSSEVVDDQKKEKLYNSSNICNEERRDKEFTSGENETDKVERINEYEGFEGRERVVDKHDQEDQRIDLVLHKNEGFDERRDEEVKSLSNVRKGEESDRVFDGEGMLSDEDDWEGIERNDLEKDFARAKGFVEFEDKEGRLAMAGNDVMLQLYGLQKVAMEGPYQEPQPMALRFFARSKWNAWQRLGNMSPEEAMEQYISILSENVPEWMEDHSSMDRRSDSFEIKELADASQSTSSDHLSDCPNSSTLKLCYLNHVPTSLNQDKE